MKISTLRKDYRLTRLHRADLLADPLQQFAVWFDQARAAELTEPNAMVLATVDRDNRPTQRHVLLKHFDQHGLVFFTNSKSRKARDIANNSMVSLLFAWLGLERQVAIQGKAEPLSRTDVLRYFLSRPRDSQLAALASPQSEAVAAREVLESRFESLKAQFAGRSVPLPHHWGGYRVVPDQIEFWQGGPSRLHDRFIYQRNGIQWQLKRLAP